MKISFVNGVRSGDEAEFALPEITIGREDGNIVRIPTEGVSRYHARLWLNPDGAWIVSDQGSTNGVKLNGVRITSDRTLVEGDLLEIGDQMIRVSGLAAEPPKVIFNPIPSSVTNPVPGLSGKRTREPGVAPGTGVVRNSAPTEAIPFPAPEAVSPSARTRVLEPLPPVSPKPAPAAPPPPAAEPVAIESAIHSGNFRLFDESKKERKEENAGNAPAKPRRRISNLTFYTVIVCVVVVVISTCIRLFSPAPAAKNAANAAAAEKPLTVYYEKVIQAPDNVFRFTMLLENGGATFLLDDIKSMRHVERTEKEIGRSNLDVLRGQLESSGIWTMTRPAAPRSRELVNRRLVVAEPGRVADIRVAGQFLPMEFEKAEAAINALAEQYGLQTIALTAEELKSQAEASFVKAEQLFADREALPSNLRDAIARYRLTVNYLDQFSPHPAMWDRARRRLAEAQQLRERKLNALNAEVARLAALKDYGKLRLVYQEVMELVDVGSVPYDKARRGLFAVDNTLRGKLK